MQVFFFASLPASLIDSVAPVPELLKAAVLLTLAHPMAAFPRVSLNRIKLLFKQRRKNRAFGFAFCLLLSKPGKWY